MSLASASLGLAVDRIHAFFGDRAVFSARGDVARACTVTLDQDVGRYGETAVVAGKTLVVGMRRAEVPEMPRKGDTIDIETGKFAGRQLVVDSVIASDEFEHRVFAA